MPDEMSPQLQEAIALVQQDPLPQDIRDRLEQLEKAAPSSEGERFGDLWEVVLVELGPEDLA